MTRRVAPLIPLAAIVVSYVATDSFRHIVLPQNINIYNYKSGNIDVHTFNKYFQNENFYYFYEDIYLTAHFIREHSAENDTVCVRGFNPEVYVLSGRRYGGRFFWSNFLVAPSRAYRRSEYLAEDREAFAKTRPRYVVTLTHAHGNLDSIETYAGNGYHLTRTFGALQVLERDD